MGSFELTFEAFKIYLRDRKTALCGNFIIDSFEYSLYSTPDDQGFLLARKEDTGLFSVFVARTDSLWDITKSHNKEVSNAERKC